MNLRDQIKAVQDRPQETVELPELGITLVVRGMSAADAMATALIPREAPDTYIRELIARCVCDEAGAPVYASAAEAAELLDKSMPVVERVMAAVRRVNGLQTEADAKKA